MIRLSQFTFLLAAIALVGAGAAPAALAWPGANGAIVFEAFYPGGEEHDRGRGIRIAPLGADRSEVVSLTDDPADGDPQVSPDGRQVVFVRSSDPGTFGHEPPTTIYLIRVDGSGLRPLTDGTQADDEPSFSASGSRVYFTRRVSGQGTDIFSVRLDGSGLRRITSGGASDRHPRLAARGGLLSFARGPGSDSSRQAHIFLARADGSRVRDLTPRLASHLAASDPEFTPDGRRVAYSTGDRLLSVRVDGKRPRLLLPPRAGSDRVYADPTFAPDGRSLLFTALDSSSASLQQLDLRDLRRLPAPLVEPHTAARSPAWLTG
ncbi:MAG: hypothetical protein ABW065_06865 [Solirubrobacterales bacterium]